MSNNPIRKRLLINIGLASGIILLAIAVWLSPNRDTQKRLFDGLDANSITEIRIENPSAVTIVIEKIDDHWEITSPLNAPANPFRVTSILNITQAISRSRYLLDTIDSIELGFNHTNTSLYLNDYQIQFGNKDPIDDLRYTQFQNTLHLIDDQYLPLISSPLDSFIDTHILPDYLTIKRYQMPDYSVTQTETGGWIVEPEVKDLASDRIQEWVDRWRRQRSSEVIYQPDVNQETSPQAVLELADGKTISFQLIQNDEWSGLYWISQKIGYKLKKETIQLLLSKPSADSS